MDYQNIRSRLPEFNLFNKPVFLRVDLNVPLKNGTIINDYRLKAIQPTLDYIIKQNCPVIIATHIGRPKEKAHDLSTEQLIPWFKKHGYEVVFATNPKHAQQLITDGSKIILLENLRFFDGEKKGDISFAKELAAVADFCVDDAFASLHRFDTSIAVLPTLFDKQHRTIGFLVEREIAMLSKLLMDQQRPRLFMLGGGKIETKLPLISKLLNQADTIILAPAIVFTFLKAQHKEIGKSLIDSSMIETAKAIVQKAEEKKVRLLFPIDYQIAENRINGNLVIVSAQAFPQNGIGISIGPKSVELFDKEIKQAKTIFFNCAMGFQTRPETLVGSKQLLTSIAESNAFSIIAGGDSVSLAQQIGLTDKFSFMSTGGGATLSFLAGVSLPGLDAIM